MHRFSSNFTLFLKLILPTMWIVFFGSLLIALFIIDPDDAPLFTTWQFRLSYILFYIVFILFFRFTVIPLKRIDADGTHIFVSNYFKTYRYKFEDIREVREINYIIFKVMVFNLKAKGSFGDKITILPDSFRISEYRKAFPDNFEHLQ